jgi:hypothetical protein
MRELSWPRLGWAWRPPWAVDQNLKKAMAEALLFGSLKNGGKAFADVKADGSGLELTFTTAEA